MSPQGRWMRRVRCMPCAAPCLRASTLAQIGPPHPSDSVMGGPRSADPEEKREPCERHPKTPIDGRNSEVLDIERRNTEARSPGPKLVGRTLVLPPRQSVEVRAR